MTLLLTGGCGYIGSHVAAALESSGRRTVLLDNLCNSDAGVVRRIGRIAGWTPAFVHADVRDTDAVAAVIRREGVSGVLHFAGLKDLARSATAPLDYYEANEAGTMSLLRAMERCGVRTLVFSSSATVYGSPARLPLLETDPTQPQCPYGRSKLHVEEMLADVAATHPDWRIASLRYFNPVGAHPAGGLGDDPPGTPPNLMPCVARVASGRMRELQVFGLDYPTMDGTAVRDYVHVMDLADGHLAALAWLQAGGRGHQVFNLGTGRGHSVLEVVAAFERACGRAVTWQAAARRTGDVAANYASARRAAHVLAWKARRGLDAMCADAWNFERQRAGAEALPCW